jgi:hypothetical protein
LEALEAREVPAIDFTAGALTVTGTAGIDQIELFGRGAGVVDVIEFSGAPVRSFSGVTSIRVDAGAEGDGIKLESVTAPATLIGGTGGDKIQYVREGAGAVNLTIDGGAGMDEIQVDLKVPLNNSTTPVTAAINVNGGADDDNIQIQSVSEAAVYHSATTVTDSSGNDNLMYQMDQKSQLGNSVLRATLVANMGGGMDKIGVKVESESQTSSFGLSGGGTSGAKEINSEVMFDGAARDVSVSYNLTTGGDMDKVGLTTLSEATRRLAINQSINTGGGNDVVTIGINQIGTQTSTATASVTSNIDLGGGDDEFLMGFAGEFAPLTLSGTITGGLGDDKMHVNVKARSLTNTLSLLGGGGTDLVEFIQ